MNSTSAIAGYRPDIGNWRDRERQRLGICKSASGRNADLPYGFNAVDMGSKIFDLVLRSIAPDDGDRTLISFRCQSPIEKIFLCALWTQAFLAGAPLQYSLSSEVSDIPDAPVGRIMLCQQVMIGKRLVDFIVRSDAKIVGIECDGRNYHDRTTEQVNRDKSRDRELLASGIPVLHFSGSELWNEPTKCVEEVIAYLHKDATS